MFIEHQSSSKGDMSFIENLLSKDMQVQHMDSYNHEDSKRFQGSFYYNFSGTLVKANDCPLAILKIASKYQTHICTQCGEPHIVWTIWF